MLSEKELKRIKGRLDGCKRPLFLFDDDPDGLCSFLLFYRYVKDGRGLVVKTSHNISRSFTNKVLNYEPDIVFILDVAHVEQKFIDDIKKLKVPIVIIDHHSPIKLDGVEYYNPLISEPNSKYPTAYLCYKVVEQDYWISVLGSVSDWVLLPYVKRFRKEYPDLLPKEIKLPEQAMFASRLGELIKIYFFILKGDNNEVLKCVKILTRIGDPYEILDQASPKGKYIFKRSEKNNKHYRDLIKRAKKSYKKDDPLFLYRYDETATSFSSYLSNEIVFLYPDKMIIIARKVGQDYRCSFRGPYDIPKMLKKALVGVDGYGGGHKHACGGSIKAKDFDVFIENIRKDL